MIELIAKNATAGPTAGALTLPYLMRQRSRLRAELDSGAEVAVLLPRGNGLVDGDRLVAADGTCILVRAAEEELSTARTEDPLLLARACYHLGNRHVALEIGEGRVRYLPDHVLDAMIEGLGLTVARELAPFQPEPGAYSGHGQTHSHPRSHGHGHDHSHADGDHDAA